ICSKSRRYRCISSRSFSPNTATAWPWPLTSASAIRETMQLGHTDTWWTSPPASPGPAGSESTHAAQPGNSTRLAVRSLLVHVSAHARCRGINRIGLSLFSGKDALTFIAFLSKLGQRERLIAVPLERQVLFGDLVDGWWAPSASDEVRSRHPSRLPGDRQS